MAKRKQKNHNDLEDDRFGLFMTEKSFETDKLFARNYIENDIKQIVDLYRIDIINTKSNKLYGTTSSKRKFLTPVALNAMVEVEPSVSESYGDSGLMRSDTGNITVKLFLKELEERDIDINQGDIVKYNMSGQKDRYYEVFDPQNVTDVTSQTIASMRPFFRIIKARPVKEDIIPFLDELDI